MPNEIMQHMRDLAQAERERADEETVCTPEEEYYCAQCGSLIEDRDDMITMDGDRFYHMECVEICEYCGNAVPQDDIVYADISFYRRQTRCACESCADSRFVRCAGCNELCTEGAIAMSDDDISICIDCQDNYRTCYECDRIIHDDDAYYNERNDEYYCGNCYPGDSENLQSYQHHQFSSEDFHFHAVDGEDPHHLYFGIEQEVDRGDDRYGFCNDLAPLTDDGRLFQMKEDGSLGEEGVEIVSMPCSFRFMMEKYPLEDIYRISLEHEYRSHDTNTCGLHVHVSRKGLGENDSEIDLTIAKIMFMVDIHWEKIVIFSRRNYYTLDRWAKKPGIGAKDTDEESELIRKSKMHDGDRYRAVNICPRNTVEFRFFKGTLNPNTVRASIQFCKVLIDYAKEHTLQTCLSVDWTTLMKSDYPQLNAYLESRNLM